MTDINLDQMRQDIDNIDEKLTDLFKERMEKSLEIAKYKKDHKVPVFSDKREKEILHKVSEQIGEPFDGYARLLFNTIFDASRSCQNNYMAKRSDLADRIEEALKGTPNLFRKRQSLPARALQDPTLRLPARNSLKCRASCISTALRAYSMLLKKAFASTGSCPSKTALTVPSVPFTT